MDQDIPLLLAKLLKEPLESIEILPGGPEEWESQSFNNFPFVLVDGHLGIPQKVLYKLYMAAVALYKTTAPDILLALSSVIILANPAHQTALNARKNLMKNEFLRPEEELKLTALFIGSSKECAKQSIIWDHRRWIFRFHYESVGNVRPEPIVEPPGWSTSDEASSYPIIPLNVLEKECELSRRACELYPRNYYAWFHYHWLLDVARVVIGRSSETSGGVDSWDHVRFLRQEVIQLRKWIDRHVSDYSAVQLLCNCTILERSGTFQLAQPGGNSLEEELREHALGLVISYPSHEALWLYLRFFLSSSTPEIILDFTSRLRNHSEVPRNLLEKYIVDLL